MKTQSREVGAEARLWAGHAEVGHHSKAQATTDSCSMYRRDNWLFGTKQSVALDIKWRDAWTWLVGTTALPVERRTVAEIGTGAKCLALGCQHDGANIDIFVEALERLCNFFDQRYIKEIVRRPPDLDQGHVPTLFDTYVTHDVCIPYPAAVRRSACCRVRLRINASATLTPSPLPCTMTGLRSTSAMSSA